MSPRRACTVGIRMAAACLLPTALPWWVACTPAPSGPPLEQAVASSFPEATQPTVATRRLVFEPRGRDGLGVVLGDGAPGEVVIGVDAAVVSGPAPRESGWLVDGARLQEVRRSPRIERFHVLDEEAGAFDEALSLTLPSGWTLRSHVEVMEIVDEAGTARLRLHRPEARDALGKRRSGMLRPGVERGGSVTVVAALDLQGLVAPIVVDPAITGTGQLAVARQSHTATELQDGRVAMIGGQGNGAATPTIELFDPATGTFTFGPSLQTARSGHTATLLADGRVLVAGGNGDGAATLASTELFDPRTGTVTAGPVLPSSRAFHTATRLDNGDVLVIGGAVAATPLGDTALLRAGASAFEASGSLARPRGLHTAMLVDGDVLVVGGLATATPLAEAERWQASTGTFVPAGVLGVARFQHAALTLATGDVLVHGGFDTSVALRSAEVWSKATQTFSAVGDLRTARRFHRSVLLPSGNALIVSGRDTNALVGDTEVFDVATRTFLPGPAVTVGRESHTVTSLGGGRALIVGGQNGNSVLGAVELFEAAVASRTDRASLPTPLTRSAVTLLDDGTVLVAGGSVDGIAAIAAARRYDPVANTFQTVGSLGTARLDHTMTRLPDGRVLILGGNDGASPLASAEVFDPVSDTFAAAGTLTAARAGHTATLLRDGQVVVAGGSAASVERFHVPTGASVDLVALPAARTEHAAVRAPDGSVLVIGGLVGGTPTTSVLRYTAATGTLTPAPSLAIARRRFTATLALDGAVVVAGGLGAANTPLAGIERLPVGGAAFVTAGSLSAARSEHVAWLAPSGRILFAGGRAAAGFALPIEAWDAAKGSAVATGAALVTGRAGAHVVGLADGQALLLGGTGAASPTTTVERIDETGVTVGAPAVSATGSLGAPGAVAVLAGSALRGDALAMPSGDATVARLVDAEGVVTTLTSAGGTSTSLPVTVPDVPSGAYRLWVSRGGLASGTVVRVRPRPATGVIPVSTLSPRVADNVGIALVEIGPVQDALGVDVADDTLVTVEVGPDSGTLLGVDADEVLPGLQVKTVFGRAAVSLRAPSTPTSTIVTVESVEGDGIGSAAVVFLPGAGAGGVSVTATPASLVADGVDATTVVLGPVNDALGNTVADGSLVNVTTTAGTLIGVDAAPAAGLQLALTDGRATFSLRAATLAGVARVTVRSTPGSAEGTLEVPLVAGPPVSPVPVAVSTATLPADGTSTTTVAIGPVTDARGNLVVDGTRFTLATTGGTLQGVDLDPNTPGLQQQTSGGRCTVSLNAPLVSGSARVTAVALDNGASGGADVTFTAAPASGTFAVVASPASTAAGAGAVVVTAGPIQNSAGTPLEDGALFTVTTSAGTVVTADADVITPGVQVAAIGGQVIFSVDPDTVARDVDVEVRALVGVAAGAGTVTVVAGPPHRVIAVPPARAVAGTDVVVPLVVTDAFGNRATTGAGVGLCVAVAGAAGGAPTVSPAGLADGTTPDPATACGTLTDGGSVTVVDTLAEDVQLAVSSVGLPGSARPESTAVVSVGAAAGDRLVVGTAGADVEACGEAEVTVTLRDAFDNVATPPAGLLVRVAASAELGTPGIVATDLVQATRVPAREVLGRLPPGGVGRITVTLDRDGPIVIVATATLPSPSIDAALRFVVGPLDAVSSELRTLADEVQSGAGSAAIEVTPRDACGVRLGPGRDVVVATSFGDLTAVVDEGDGRYSATFTAPAGLCPGPPASITATVDGVALSTTATVAVRCGAVGEPPRIDRSANAFAARERPYVYDDDRRVSAGGTPPIRYSLVSGPPGMVVGDTSGRIDWLPLAAGPVRVEIAARNAAGVEVYGFDVDVSADPPPPPVAEVGATPVAGSVPLAVAFDSAASTASNGASILVSRWNFGDGSPPGFGVTAAHTYLRPGGWIARLQIADSLGGTATATTGITVTAGDLVPPLARIVASSTDGADGLQVTFTCDCTVGSAPIASYLWELGDGTVSVAPEVTHSFSPAAWEVRLVVTDAAGLSAQDRRQIVVLDGAALPPQIFAQASPVAGPAPLSIRLSADAGDLDGRVETVRWRLSDGRVFDGEDVDVTFETPGVYVATAVAVDDDGLEAQAAVELQLTGTGEAVPPVIVSVADLTASVGEAYVYDVDDRPAARGDRPLVWSLGKVVDGERFGVPAGATIDATTGRIRWTPTAPGVVPVVLACENPAGQSFQQFDVVVDGEVEVVDPGCGCSSSPTSRAGLVGLCALLWAHRRRRRLRRH